MPYEYLPAPEPNLHLHLWPYRSLPRRGFVGFIAATATLLALPLPILIGSPILWGILPFLIAAIAAIYGLETLVAAVQAYVFTILTCVYLRDAVGDAHH